MARSELFKQGLILLRSIVKESTSPLMKKRAKLGLQQLHFKHLPHIFPYDKLDKLYLKEQQLLAHKVSLPADAELRSPTPVSPTFAPRTIGSSPPRSPARHTIWWSCLAVLLRRLKVTRWGPDYCYGRKCLWTTARQLWAGNLGRQLVDCLEFSYLFNLKGYGWKLMASGWDRNSPSLRHPNATKI